MSLSPDVLLSATMHRIFTMVVPPLLRMAEYSLILSLACFRLFEIIRSLESWISDYTMYLHHMKTFQHDIVKLEHHENDVISLKIRMNFQFFAFSIVENRAISLFNRYLI